MFTIHARLLPQARSYNEAWAVYESAHKYPRSSSNARGLKDARDTTKTVFIERGEEVCFQLHNTVVVRWSPENVRVGFYDSSSTVVFANQFLPNGMRAITHKREMYIACSGMYYVPKRGEMDFRFIDGLWTPDPTQVHRTDTTAMDHKRAARIRQILKPFMDWKMSIDRLKGGAPTAFLKAEGYALLRTALHIEELDQIYWPSLVSYGAAADPDFMKQCYVLGGAVTKVQAPFGSLPKPTPYENLIAWGWT